MLLFWIAAAVLTAGTVLVLLRPLLKTDTRGTGGAAAPPADSAERSDITIYRDQLTEIDADKARGLLNDADAEAARAEIARRLIARVDAIERAAAPDVGSDTIATTGQTPSSAVGRSALAYGFVPIGLVIPVLAIGLYLGGGSPGMPAKPLSARLSQPISTDSRLDELIARVEARLRTNPGDGAGWDVIAPIYLRLERFTDAADAWRRAIDLLGESPARLSGFAEASVMAASGVVGEPARRAYARLLELQPGRPEARLGLALAKEQDGKMREAAADYRSLLDDSPRDAPWRGFVERRLAAIAEQQGQAAAGSADGRGRAPSEGDVAALATVPEAERRAMVLSMVEGLASRLRTNGRDVEGWRRLLRAWVVLGQHDKAEAALLEARKSLNEDETGLSDINAFAKTLGLKS